MTTVTGSRVRKPTGKDILGPYADGMIRFLIDVLHVPRFESELAVGQLWDRWIAAYQKRYGGPELAAHAALTAALVYITDPDTKGQSPGKIADPGWHVMLEHDTRCYMALTNVALGYYRHHVPNDVSGIVKQGKCNDSNDGGGSSNCVCS